ncbi:MAG: hypothetical protein JWP88_1113 [Flaviaesturariibacter sp.]|nr:hypothetical protein [Flaviaesturariibacter sp.]
MKLTPISKRQADLFYIVGLCLLFILLYYPVWHADYLYTDEATQLWYYGKRAGYQMFANQGRGLTEKLMLWLFGSINTIAQVKSVRLFSFGGWLLVIPAWYYVLKSLFVKQELPAVLAAVSVSFLICLPGVSISVLWASCLELFIANTAGLLSGFFLYRAIKQVGDRIEVSSAPVWLAFLFGLISLFSYQNGFGFYCLPFILHALRSPDKKRHIFIGIGGFFVIAAIYFLLFKYNLRTAHVEASARTSLHIAPWNKFKFFFSRPMSSAFHFTYLFNEKNLTGYIVYAVLFGSWIASFWMRNRKFTFSHRAISFGLILALLALSYFPSLLVQENYSSNRTTIALHVAVFILAAESFFYYWPKAAPRRIVGMAASLLFIINAAYNTRVLFFQPIQKEYTQLRNYMNSGYTPTIQAVYFIQPSEDFFVRQYGLTRSWDEFGVPSTFFNWVPEHFVRQIVFEKTGNRKLAESVRVKQWANQQAFVDFREKVSPAILLIDAEKIIASPK